jgi:hypothetical protein
MPYQLGIRPISVSTPPAVKEVLQLQGEIYGYLSGRVSPTSLYLLNQPQPLSGRQVYFHPRGHNHNGSNSFRIHPDALTKRAIDLNSAPLLWGSLYGEKIGPQGWETMLTSAYKAIAIGDALRRFLLERPFPRRDAAPDTSSAILQGKTLVNGGIRHAMPFHGFLHSGC